MKIQPFELERYFARYEFSVPYLLSSSDCEPFSLPEMLEMADISSKRLWQDQKLGYTDSQGHPLLRQEITELYQDISSEETVVITPEEGIFIVMNILLSPGDHIIVTYPGYQSLYEIARAQGCLVSRWTPDETGCFRLSDFRKLVNKRTRLIVINFPHNPTGSLITSSDLMGIVQMAQEQKIFIFSDEMYRFLEYDAMNRLPSLPDIYEDSIALSGMSKTFALAGLRIGWLTTKNKSARKQILEFKDYTTICSSAPSEILAIIGLRNKTSIINRNLAIIEENLENLATLFSRYPDIFKWSRPQGGTVLFPELKIKISSEELCERLLARKEVMLAPAQVFGYTKNCVRFGLGRKNMAAGLEKLEEFIREELL